VGALTKNLSGLRDPLFLGCCALYVMNRFVIKPHVAGGFVHNWFNDLLLIPCALPILLAVHRALGLREHDGPPTTIEVATHLAGWAFLCEVLGSRLLHRGTGDPFDVLAYAIGALLAMFWWQRENSGRGRKFCQVDGYRKTAEMKGEF
jgi:hypothetical protein